MKFIEHNGNFQIAPDDIKEYDTLPVGYYKISYDEKHDAYSLDRTYNITTGEPKVYGNQTEKLNKVIRAYDVSVRSLGVLLTGDKGIGKSLFAKSLCMAMYMKGLPIIIVDKAYKGLERFLSEIPGEVVLLFDEFDKVFEKYNSNEGRDESSQQSLLSLFDGTSSQKRLFIATANGTDNLDSCIINRTGRFHYHFIFDYPTDDDIIKYLKDNMNNFDQDEANKIVQLSRIAPINYDSLRSIVFEFNLGYKFEEFIDDLNIKSVESYVYFKFIFKTKDGGNIALYNSVDCDTVIMNGSEIGLSKKQGDYHANYNLTIKNINLDRGEIVDYDFYCGNEEELKELNIYTDKPVKFERINEGSIVSFKPISTYK